jgi:excisionase family DNA binding protein
VEFIGTAEAAQRLGISQKRVNVLIQQGRLPASKVGNVYMINSKDLAKVKDRKPGRPAKGKK